jgi:kinesin family protein 15
MREDAKKGVYVENLSEVEVKGVNDVIRLLLQVSFCCNILLIEMNSIERK